MPPPPPGCAGARRVGLDKNDLLVEGEISCLSAMPFGAWLSRGLSPAAAAAPDRGLLCELAGSLPPLEAIRTRYDAAGIMILAHLRQYWADAIPWMALPDHK